MLTLLADQVSRKLGDEFIENPSGCLDRASQVAKLFGCLLKVVLHIPTTCILHIVYVYYIYTCSMISFTFIIVIISIITVIVILTIYIYMLCICMYEHIISHYGTAWNLFRALRTAMDWWLLSSLDFGHLHEPQLAGAFLATWISGLVASQMGSPVVRVWPPSQKQKVTRSPS